MTLAEALKKAKQTLEPLTDTAMTEAYQLLGKLLNKQKADLLIDRHLLLTLKQEETMQDWLERRTKGEPLQYLVGAGFYGLELHVSQDVLVPRPETERMVELLLADLQDKPNPKVLDLATGSGAIALAIKAEQPRATVIASDISSKALTIAKRNATSLNLDVSFFQSDLFNQEIIQVFAKQADAIIANLPYLPETDKAALSPEVHYDPNLALFAGEDGLEVFWQFEEQAFNLLQAKTLVWLELDPRNVKRAYEGCAHWAERTIENDLLDRQRFLRLLR